jgi:UTP--glucose-1-phosphate uridylyltransferase
MLKKLAPRKGEIYLTDAMDELAENGELLASTFEGIRYDVGDKFGYIKANVEYALMSDEIGGDTAQFIKELASKL